MVSKKTKQAKRAAAAAAAEPTSTNGNTPPPTANGTTTSEPSSSKQPTPEPEEEDITIRAEKVKEEGNVAFRAGRYEDAINLYSDAIRMNPKEPSYLTNRAASYIQIKRFRPALEDCQQAVILQTPPPSKTILRLARCQLALGQPTPAMSTLNPVLASEPTNSTALQLKLKILELEERLRHLNKARKEKDWSVVRLVLDQCLKNVEAEGAEVPMDWRLCRVEMELAKGNWDAANQAANDALRMNPTSPEILTVRGQVLFLSGKIPAALQNLTSALRFDPSYEAANKLRKRIKEVERLKEEGNVLFKKGDWTAAVDRYTGALDAIGAKEEECKGGQIRATLLSNRATTLVKLNEYDRALEDTDTSLLLSPLSFKALRTRARIHLHLSNFSACVSDFKSAIELANSDDSITEREVRDLKSELKKAQVAEKRSKTKDYYKILGVARDCTEMEIKKGYRRESLKHHPDKGGDEEKFKLVVEAHAVLSDPERRQRYDDGEDEDGMNDGGGGNPFGMSQADMASLFAQFAGGPHHHSHRSSGGFSFGGPGSGFSF